MAEQDGGVERASPTRPGAARIDFADDLKAIDPGLVAKSRDGPDGDKDARDIVRKSGYLLKIAKARPEIVLKCIMSKFGVLVAIRADPGRRR